MICLLYCPSCTADAFRVADLVSVGTMVVILILDGNSEIGAHVRSNLCYLIWAVINRIFFIRIDLFSFMRAHKYRQLQTPRYFFYWNYLYFLRGNFKANCKERIMQILWPGNSWKIEFSLSMSLTGKVKVYRENGILFGHRGNKIFVYLIQLKVDGIEVCKSSWEFL